ncbi:MAG: site-specific integrase [Rhizobiaceae bacterium]|nr:site-specific integrase [Rhizobiaceae bacterium]
MAKLTKSIVDKAEPRAKPYFVWCSKLSGFGVRVFPSGTKNYVADYRVDGQRRRMTIGPHGKLTTDEARELATGILGGAIKGEDPLTERRTRRGAITVDELCDDYLDAAEKGLILGKGRKPKKPSTLYIDRGRIDRHIRPLLGRKRVVDLERSDIVKWIADVTIGKTAKVEKTGRLRGKSVVEGGAGTATRTAGLLSGVLAFAVSQGIIDRNPVHGVPRPADGKRERRLSAEEYRKLGEALAESVEAWQAVAAVRLLALTGCRRGEIANLRWTEVDFDGSALRLGDSKTGASTRPLSNEAAAVLRGLGTSRRGVWVLPGVRGPEKPFGALANALGRIFAHAGLPAVTAHTLRHSFASVAADLDFSDATIGAMIGHAGAGITSRYTHRLDSVLVAAANRVAAEVHRQMTGEETAKVVEMPRRA